MKNLLSLFSLFVSMLFISCNSEDMNPTTQNSVDVYVAGQKNNQACYWKNNQEVLLSDNGSYSRADTLLVKNGVIHVAGLIADNGDYDHVYWKNSVLTNLSETLSTPSHMLIKITGMDVVGDDVYFVGYTKNPLITAEMYELAYWKNGVKTELASATNPTYRSKIKVVNNTVYVTAFNLNCFNSCNGFYVNGAFTAVDFNITLEDFAVKDNEVYVYGNNYTTQTGYFKNITTNVETTTPNTILKMIFELNNTYILNDNSITKNGAATTTAVSSNGITSYTSYIKDFNVLNGNVYYINNCAPLLGLPFCLVGINNTNVFQIDNGSSYFNGITIVQN